MTDKVSTQGYDHQGNPEEWGYTMEEINEMIADGEKFKNGEFTEGDIKERYNSVRGFLNDVGCIFSDGIGMPKDLPLAVWYFEKAIEEGEDVVAGCNLGDIYRKGAEGVEQDYAKAFKAYFSSYHPYAQYRVGEAYEKGWGVEADLEMAKKNYIRSAQLGHRMGIKRCKELGLDYEIPTSIADDEEDIMGMVRVVDSLLPDIKNDPPNIIVKPSEEKK